LRFFREQNREADALANEAMDEADGKSPSSAASSKVESGNSKIAGVPAIKVRARFRSGVLYPLEDINLPDGAEVEILLRPTSKS